MGFWKLLDHSYVQSPFSTNTRHINNNILKDTIQFVILRTWINMRAKSFIRTSVNVTEMRIAKRALGRTLDQNRNYVSLILCAFFLTNQVFKFKSVDWLFFDNINHNLLFCLLINIYINDLKFCQVPYAFLKGTVKFWLGSGFYFWRFSASMLKLCSYFVHEKYLVKAKITLDLKNCLYAA